jgi:hypothetical protein
MKVLLFFPHHCSSYPQLRAISITRPLIVNFHSNFKTNLQENENKHRNADTTSLPTLSNVPVSVRDGSHGYIIGGIGRVPEGDGSFHPSNGMVR